MRPIIEFCVNNEAHGSTTMEKLEAHPEFDVIDYGCLGHCGECFIQPYALVNGEFVFAADVDTLYDAICEKVKQWQADLDMS